MSLIKCSECQAEISDKAVACPKCGNPMASIVPEKSGTYLNETQLMERYGVSFSGEKYISKGYQYAKLEDAINYAKSQINEENQQDRAHRPTPIQKSRWWMWIVIPVGTLAAVILFGSYQNSKPENAGKSSARMAVDLCRNDLSKAKTYAEQQIISGACEKLQRDYESIGNSQAQEPPHVMGRWEREALEEAQAKAELEANAKADHEAAAALAKSKASSNP